MNPRLAACRLRTGGPESAPRVGDEDVMKQADVDIPFVPHQLSQYGKDDLLIRHVNDDVASTGSAVHCGHDLRQYGLQDAPSISPKNYYPSVWLS
jgi:hypothetical protein